jgi:elongation factor G
MGNGTQPMTRNLALVGHGNTGKTTLAESVLFLTKTVTRKGTIEDGTTVSDYTPIEKDRKNSITASVMHCQWKKCLLNLIDTPGFPDFQGEAISGIAAADIVLLTVAANSGIQVNTRTMWKLAREAGKAVALLITKLDAENTSFTTLLEEIRETFGSHCVPVTVPTEEGPGLSAVVDLLSGDGENHESREMLVEALVETDDALMEKYLEGETVDPAELKSIFRKAMNESTFVPVFAVAALKDVGVEALVNYAVDFMPSPAESLSFRRLEGEEEKPLTPAVDGSLVAQVFKTVTDDYVGKLSYFRVISGSGSTDAPVLITREEKKVKLQNVFQLQGKDQTAVGEIHAGGIYAVSKIDALRVSDTLCAPGSPQDMPPLRFPEPMVFVALSPKSRQDEQRISSALTKLSDEDPTFKVTRHVETNEMVATGMSQLHLDLKLKTLKSRFGVEVTTRPPRIPFRETIMAKASSKYRHKKQTGGAGQFAEVWLRVEPLQSEAMAYEGFEFGSEVYGGAISQNFIPSIEKGIKAVMKEGVIAGYPIDGIKAVVYDGKEHPVDSKDIAFQIAGREAFKLAVKDAKPVLLEPIVNVEVTVPSQYMGEITGDLNTRRGRIQGMESEGQFQVIRAQVPQAEIMNYSTDLRSLTGGEASFVMRFSHYDVVPSNLAADIIARSSRKGEDADK